MRLRRRGFARGRRSQRRRQLTPLIYATRANDLESVKVLLAAGADINQTSGYGWSPLLVAAQNRYYKLGAYLLEHGANPNLANKGGWTPLYLATDNRNIENGDYPVRKGDMDHLEFITLLLDKGANVNAASRTAPKRGRSSPTSGSMRTARQRFCARRSPATSR